MTRQLDEEREARAARRQDRVLLAINGGLYSGVSRAGGVLLGFSVKLDEFDCLLTLRAEFPAGRMVAFVGGYDLGDVLQKAAKGASSDGLRWRTDKWGKSTIDGE